MTEFLTGNTRLAYPLDSPIPDAAGQLWTQLLADACIATDVVLEGGARLSLVSVERVSGSRLAVVVGAQGAGSLTVDIGRGLADFAVVYASSDHIKAMLVVNGRTADAIMDSSGYGTGKTTVNVPFALRCTSCANRMVTSVSAYSAAACSTPVFTGAETPAKTLTGGDIVVAAKEGIDLESTRLMPLDGRILRLSAISAPAEASETDTDVDLMLRSDGCFTVDTIPGAKVVGNTVQARTESEPDGLGVLGGGVISIGNVCKPCCQCEDYRAAADAIRDPESLAIAVEQILNDAKLRYDEAVAEFEAWKAGKMAEINSLSNVRCRATATFSQNAYPGSAASGKRSRVAITLSVENMTQRNVIVSGIGFSTGDAGFSEIGVSWKSVSRTTASGSSMPVSRELVPGGTLVVVSTWAKTSTTNSVTPKPGAMTAQVTVSANGETLNRTVDVSS